MFTVVSWLPLPLAKQVAGSLATRVNSNGFIGFINACLSYFSYQNKQRHNISTRTTLKSTQLLDGSIINGAKLINLSPESPLFGRLISWLDTCSNQRSQYMRIFTVFTVGMKNLGGLHCLLSALADSRADVCLCCTHM